MKKINLKSLVIGLVLGICVTLVTGAAGDMANIGRYRISSAGDSSTACFVIDTVTGRTWRRYSHSRGNYMGCPADWDKTK